MNPAVLAALCGAHVSVMAAAAEGFVFANVEAAVVVAAMTSPPDDARKQLIDDLVGSLKNGVTSGSDIWAKLDFLWVLAAADSQASLIDWKGSYDLTANDAPTFTADRGWNGDGATAGMNLSSAFTPSTAGGQWGTNSAHIGAFNLTAASSSAISAGASTAVVSGGTGSPGGWIGTNFFGETPAPAGSAPHHICISRTGNTTQVAYRNGVGGSTQTSSASAVVTPIFVLSDSAGGPATDANISLVHGGAGLSAAEVLDLYNAVATYLAGVGA
ncbi:MAG TPA: hypothetical protein VGF77_05680 [Allosphingosinicella sp.]|jgi:hypothetical protein